MKCQTLGHGKLDPGRCPEEAVTVLERSDIGEGSLLGLCRCTPQKTSVQVLEVLLKQDPPAVKQPPLLIPGTGPDPLANSESLRCGQSTRAGTQPPSGALSQL